MKNYEHITEMENILDTHNAKLKELEELLTFLEKHRADFERLKEYYYSERRDQDLKDEEAGLIDRTLKRGVLSEDAVYNMITDYYRSCVKMLEITANFFKHH